MSRTALGIYSFTYREIKVQLTQILFISWWPDGLWYEKGAGKQCRSDCYKYLSLSSLSSFWLCFTPKTSFPLGHSTSVSVLTWEQDTSGTPGLHLGPKWHGVHFPFRKREFRHYSPCFPQMRSRVNKSILKESTHPVVSCGVLHVIFPQYNYCLPCWHLRIASVDPLVCTLAIREILNKSMQCKPCTAFCPATATIAVQSRVSMRKDCHLQGFTFFVGQKSLSSVVTSLGKNNECSYSHMNTFIYTWISV